MSQQRKPKRQRKKEARAAKRQALMEYQRQRQRTRRITVGVATIVFLGAIGGIVLALTGGDDTPAAAPTPSPGASPAPAECSADDGEDGRFDEPADQGLEPSKAAIWRLETTKGTIDIELDLERAPLTSNSIAFLTSEGYFDDLTFHRVVPDFVIQGGDPSGDGTGGPGYTCVEPPPSDLVYEPGVVAMAKTGAEPPGASGSQFFIVSGPDAASLPVEFALVGKVVKGMDVVAAIEGVGVPASAENPAPTPSEIVRITKASII